MINEEGIDLRWIFEMVRRWFWLILGCALLAAAAAFVVITLIPPTYAATTTLLVGQAQDPQSSEYTSLIAGEQLAQTYTQMLKGQSIMQAVISQLNLAETPGSLANSVTVIPVSGTQLIRLTVENPSPTQAALLANSIANAFITQIQTLRSGRYSDSLTSIQEKIKLLSDQISETQSEIDALDVKLEQEEQQLTRLENDLNNNNRSSQALGQSIQSLQMTVFQLYTNVGVMEAARVGDYANHGFYQATVTLLLNSTAITGAPNDLMLVQMLKGQPVLDAVIAKLGLSESTESIASRVSVLPVENTQMVRLYVDDKDKSQAALLADAIANAFVLQVQKIIQAPYESQLAGLQKQVDDLDVVINQVQADISQVTIEKNQTDTEISRLESLLTEYRNDYRTQQQNYEQLRLTAANVADTVVVSEKATVPGKPNQNRLINSLLFGVVGLMFGAGTAYVLDQLNDKIRSVQDVSDKLKLTLLGSILKNGKDEDELVMVTQPASYMGESFRVLSTNIRLSTIDRPLKSLIVTSPAASEGKSIIAANLAVAFVKAGLKVVLVDADLRFPRQHQLFGLDKDLGLTGALLKGTTYGCLQNTQFEQLKILTSGEVPSNPAELIGSDNFKKLLEELRAQADLLVIDSPPVLPVADACILAAVTDGTLLVVRASQTSTRAVRDAAERLKKVRANLMGVALNDVPENRDGYYSYYGYPGDKSNGGHTRRGKSQARNSNGHKTKVQKEEEK